MNKFASLYRNMNEKNERTKFVPLHQQINVDHIEAAFMVSSMIHEMPVISSKRQSNKFFKKLLDNYEKNVNSQLLSIVY
jgi:hypothetical protein